MSICVHINRIEVFIISALCVSKCVWGGVGVQLESVPAVSVQRQLGWAVLQAAADAELVSVQREKNIVWAEDEQVHSASQHVQNTASL